MNLSTKPSLQLPHCPQKQPFSPIYHQILLFLNLHLWHLDTTQHHMNHSLNRWQRELRHLKDPHLVIVSVKVGPFELWCQQNKVVSSEPTISNIADFFYPLTYYQKSGTCHYCCLQNSYSLSFITFWPGSEQRVGSE